MTTSATRTDGVAAGASVAGSDELLRSREYLRLLVLAAALGIPISALAYFFLQLVAHLQRWAAARLDREPAAGRATLARTIPGKDPPT